MRQDEQTEISSIPDENWREGYLRNERHLIELAAWALEECDVAELVKDDEDLQKTPSLIVKYTAEINDELTRVTMTLLGRKALRLRGDGRQRFSLRSLAKAVDEPKFEAVQRQLRRRTLPILTKAGLIEGFEEREEWSSKAHDIVISDLGLTVLLQFLERCAAHSEPIEIEMQKTLET